MARPITIRELRPLDLGAVSSGRLICISDIHLKEGAREAGSNLIEFLHKLDADILFLAGDIFDFWLGDRHSRTPAYADVILSLRECAGRGIRLVALRGNRDFLAQDFFRKQLGATVARDAVTFTTGGRNVLVTHGDAICTWDSRYGAWRRVCSTRWFAGVMGIVPLPVARFLGRMARLASRFEVSVKPGCSVEDFLVGLGALYKNGIDVVVAGHVHRMAARSVTVNGRKKELFILGGWDEAPGYLEIESGNFRLRSVSEALSTGPEQR